MPLALTPKHYDAWLDPDHQDPDELRALLGQPADGHLDVRPVSTAVNNGPNSWTKSSPKARPPAPT
jgi:putative SOS response-associated peptidase YedK